MTELAKEYGEGLFDLAREENLLDEIHEELNELSAWVKAEPDCIRLLQSHALKKADRLSIVDDSFRGRIHAYVLNFIKLLLERGALSEFENCARHYHQRWCEEKGIAEARVTSAAVLTDAQQQALIRRLSEISGKNVRLIMSIDASVMGGLRVDMEGFRYDNTIRHRLDLMRRRLTDEA